MQTIYYPLICYQANVNQNRNVGKASFTEYQYGCIGPFRPQYFLLVRAIRATTIEPAKNCFRSSAHYCALIIFFCSKMSFNHTRASKFQTIKRK